MGDTVTRPYLVTKNTIFAYLISNFLILKMAAGLRTYPLVEQQPADLAPRDHFYSAD